MYPSHLRPYSKLLLLHHLGYVYIYTSAFKYTEIKTLVLSVNSIFENDFNQNNNLFFSTSIETTATPSWGTCAFGWKGHCMCGCMVWIQTERQRHRDSIWPVQWGYLSLCSTHHVKLISVNGHTLNQTGPSLCSWKMNCLHPFITHFI